MTSSTTIIHQVTQVCRTAGLDLIHPFQVEQFNRFIEDKYRLSDFGRVQSLGLLIGNSHALWHPLLETLAARPDLREQSNPINAYVEEVCETALSTTLNLHHIRYAHDIGDRLVPMQRLAHLTGLAHLGPAQLNVHAEFGPWIALRAVIVIDVPGPSAEAAPDPCTPCAKPCLAALDIALKQDETFNVEAVQTNWRAWLAVRDACPEGKPHRYTQDQIRYHYEKDRVFLRALALRA